ncbi:hypothetical protein AB0I60_27335 [Actinosynnema sp. NPDC050436]|uniref:hypothetical protein n=1 Tax=Actinosynnema sp. NPDC050436 TaxID=3155659 RepID=UPI0033D002A7
MTIEAALLTAPEDASPLFGWGPPVRLPPWAGRHAVHVVAEALRETATDAQPLAATRGHHAALHRIRSAGHFYRLTGQEAGTLHTELPNLDDRVVHACLSVRPAERGTPWRFKPLPAGAMRDAAPEAF